ncbi:MAG: hypothetical protein UHK60_05880 [Acutalibacteraceae bacterium]|nr:hypothetical protein [Acutalibacteraceae bacterium]
MSEVLKSKGRVVEEKSAITDEELALINTYTRRQYNSDELYVFNVVLCDNEIDRDYEAFSVNALNQLSLLFIGKTGIANHNPIAENQTARIFACNVEAVQGKKTSYGSDYYRLLARAYIPINEFTQKDIQLIESGIKKEVSVGCSVDEILCSECGANIRINHCEHYKGENGCYHILNSITDAYEWSFVVVPSQREAGVIKSYNTDNKEVNMESIISEIKKGNYKALDSSNSEYLAEYIKQLEVDAKYGKAFRESLEKEYIRYCGLCHSNSNADMLTQVAKKLTLKELEQFVAMYKSKLEGKSYCTPQLYVNSTNSKDENTDDSNSYNANINNQYNI